MLGVHVPALQLKNCRVVSCIIWHPTGIKLKQHAGVNMGEQYAWRYKCQLYAKADGLDLVSTVSAIPPIRTFVVSDAEAIKFITKERYLFMKPLAIYAALGMFGMNVGITEGSDWTRHRRIVAGPTFAETTNRRAWDETARTMEACFEDWKAQATTVDGRQQVQVPSVVTLMLKIALFSVAGAGFSQHFPWQDDAKVAIPPNHTLSFRHALHICLEKIFWKIALPNVSEPFQVLARLIRQAAFNLPNKNLREIGTAFRELGQYLQDMITERRTSGFDPRISETGQTDLLGSLVYSNSNSSDVPADEPDELELTKKKATLSDEEVMGNIYVFIVAGHDTTAHTLAFALALLAVYPEVQDKLSDHIHSVLGDAEPTFEDFSKLTYVLAVFQETLRLYPSVVVIPKYAMQDTLVPFVRERPGQPPTRDQVLIPEGGEVFLNAVALHYNPRHWGEDADEFRPERFLDTETYQWPRDAFLAFSSGPRSCLGQKFAQVEAVNVLSSILGKYRVRLKEDVDGTAPVGETQRAKRDRITSCKTVITLTPSQVPMVFEERL